MLHIAIQPLMYEECFTQSFKYFPLLESKIHQWNSQVISGSFPSFNAIFLKGVKKKCVAFHSRSQAGVVTGDVAWGLLQHAKAHGSLDDVDYFCVAYPSWPSWFCQPIHFLKISWSYSWYKYRLEVVSFKMLGFFSRFGSPKNNSKRSRGFFSGFSRWVGGLVDVGWIQWARRLWFTGARKKRWEPPEVYFLKRVLE